MIDVIDLDALRRASAGPGGEPVPVTRRWLKAVADEIAAGRSAAAAMQRHAAIELVCAELAR